jgi:hypothetical protein
VGKVQWSTQAIIKNVSPLGQYVRCNSHCLNLVVCKSAHIPEIRNAIGQVKEIIQFFRQSSKRTLLLKAAVDKCLPESVRSVYLHSVKHVG